MAEGDERVSQEILIKKFLQQKQPSITGANMSKRVAVILVLVVLTASCTVIAEPALSSDEVKENSWTTLAPMPTPRSGFGLAVVDEKIFVIGGYKNGEYLGTTELYNPETDTWINKTAMPTPRSGFAIAVVQNKIHVIGGFTGVTSSTNVHEVYDPVTDTWTSRENSPLAYRSGITANVVDNKIYVISGCTSPFRPWTNTKENNVYDPETDKWTTRAPIPTAVYDYGSTTLDNKIYVFGGRSIPDNKTYSLTQIYDTQTDTWSTGTSTPMALSGFGVASTTGVQAPKRIYLFNGYKCKDDGGFSYSENVYVTLIYNPKTDTWDRNAEVLNRRSSVVTSHDVIYAIDGYDGENYSSFSGKYLPIGYSESAPSPIASPESTLISNPIFIFYIGLALLSIVAVAAIGLFVYFKKRKR